MSPSLETPDRQVRISRIAGRYLVFDIDDVAYIRREHGICAVFTGTMPQAPTQNVFLGLPVELYAEEARLLVDKKAGYIVDDTADHLFQLKTMNPDSRRAYLQSLGMQRRQAKQVFDETKAQSQAKHKQKVKEKKKKAPRQEVPEDTSALPEEKEQEESLFGTSEPLAKQQQVQVQPKPPKDVLPRVTPTTSSALINVSLSTSSNNSPVPLPSLPLSCPLHSYLNARGYFITPGLRFGGDYSVYPGDPFRYHAHYLANSYEWDQEIPMLDLLTSGRLGTAVKKSFLFGGKDPSKKPSSSSASSSSSSSSSSSENGAVVDGQQDSDMRVFCVEWAGM